MRPASAISCMIMHNSGGLSCNTQAHSPETATTKTISIHGSSCIAMCTCSMADEMKRMAKLKEELEEKKKEVCTG